MEFQVEAAGERLDKLIAAHLTTISRTQVQALIKEGHVTVNGSPVKAGVRLRGGEVVRVLIPHQPETPVIEPEAVELNVVYDDDAIAVIDKPAGMVVHQGVGSESGTLANALLARWPQIERLEMEASRRGIVHRLDKDTSGLMVIAKTQQALEHLAAQFQARRVEKVYTALLERKPKTATGRIEAPIARDPRQRKRMAVVRDGKPAVTEFALMDDNFQGDRALVEFRLLTGRTHQIRVHAAFIGCPVVGDTVYGFRKQRIKLKRNFLHAARLAFDHPVTGQRLSFESPLPAGLQNILEKLRS